jgi:hypothetical protein
MSQITLEQPNVYSHQCPNPRRKCPRRTRPTRPCSPRTYGLPPLPEPRPPLRRLAATTIRLAARRRRQEDHPRKTRRGTTPSRHPQMAPRHDRGKQQGHHRDTRRRHHTAMGGTPQLGSPILVLRARTMPPPLVLVRTTPPPPLRLLPAVLILCLLAHRKALLRRRRPSAPSTPLPKNSPATTSSNDNAIVRTASAILNVSAATRLSTHTSVRTPPTATAASQPMSSTTTPLTFTAKNTTRTPTIERFVQVNNAKTGASVTNGLRADSYIMQYGHVGPFLGIFLLATCFTSSLIPFAPCVIPIMLTLCPARSPVPYTPYVRYLMLILLMHTSR